MKFDILCSEPEHPVMPWLERWQESRVDDDVQLVTKRLDLRSGDILFLISCSEIIGPEIRRMYRRSFVLHASDLPKGRGWSPHIWEIMHGADVITLTLLEAAEPVDTGDIWAKLQIPIPRTALYDEICERLFEAEVELMDKAVLLVKSGHKPVSQTESSTSWPRRHPEDSALDPNLPLAKLFDQMRVADPKRFPAFFDLRGARYQIKLTQVELREEP